MLDSVVAKKSGETAGGQQGEKHTEQCQIREQTSMTMKQVLALIFGMGIPARTQVLPLNLTFSTIAGVASHEAMRLL